MLAINITGGVSDSDEPPVEKPCVVPEGFIEDLSVNISMIRRRLRDPNLVIEKPSWEKDPHRRSHSVY